MDNRNNNEVCIDDSNFGDTYDVNGNGNDNVESRTGNNNIIKTKLRKIETTLERRHQADKTPKCPEDDRCRISQTSLSATTTGTTSNANKRSVFSGSRNSKESYRVKVSKYLVIVSILVAGAFTSTFMYRFLSNQKKEDSSKAFLNFASSIENIFKFQVKNIFEANRALSRQITAIASTTNQSFPFVDVYGFESYAESARKKGRFTEVIYAPLVSDESAWLKYSSTHSRWYSDSQKILAYSESLKLEQNQSINYLSGNENSDDSININSTNHSLRELYNNDRFHQVKRIAQQANVVNSYDSDNGFAEAKASSMYIVNKQGFVEKKTTTDLSSIVYPTFHTSPPPPRNATAYQNVDLSSVETYKMLSSASNALKDSVFSAFGQSFSVVDTTPLNQSFSGRNPLSIAVQPVYDSLRLEANDTVGFLFTIIKWERFLISLLPESVTGIQLVLQNSCGQSITYNLNGPNPVFLGEGDMHDTLYEPEAQTIEFDENYLKSKDIVSEANGHCLVSLTLFPTKEFKNRYSSNTPVILTTVIACLFTIMAIIFLRYDHYVDQRNEKVLTMLSRSNLFVTSLFPSNVAHRLLEERQNDVSGTSNTNNGSLEGKHTLTGFLRADHIVNDEYNQAHNGLGYKTKPIADLFTETTVLFSDIAGFTAWSSVREPCQVFTLLETIYRTFDLIARQLGVFKVETIGDCYVAVTGLPDPRKDHAVVMARFARNCMLKMWSLTKKLETKLGPGTADLTMRMGLHSGPVTGGVLRGEKARFQLFGDTMNTTARIETNGLKNRIHLSQETADLIILAGKTSWIRPREDKVYAKGKGEMQTYWLNIDDNLSPPSQHNVVSNQDAKEANMGVSELKTKSAADSFPFDERTKRLVDWNVQVLKKLLLLIVERRNRQQAASKLKQKRSFDSTSFKFERRPGEMVIDEVKEIIALPGFEPSTNKFNVNSGVKPDVIDQLEHYVATIASLYRDNPFHNFGHASHVTMSVVKLLSRIVAPSESDYARIEKNCSEYSLHDHTYGITSDPLTQFACVLSALIHDVDHQGVPNAQLVQENAPVAKLYRNKSIAEQNSVDLAWNILFSEPYKELRAAIYSDEIEMNRFRQLVVNSVMATDIVDKDLKQLRNSRWEKAFNKEICLTGANENEKDAVNRKATIVIEHLIQASDISHTMQHWHVYRKWNEQFFMECYNAYKMGRAVIDPSTNWYQGEIGFFDFYVIPLAKKLKDCGVFGVSSDEYLNYAVSNRAEWARRGEEIVNEMIERMKTKSESK